MWYQEYSIPFFREHCVVAIVHTRDILEIEFMIQLMITLSLLLCHPQVTEEHLSSPGTVILAWFVSILRGMKLNASKNIASKHSGHAKRIKGPFEALVVWMNWNWLSGWLEI